MSGYDYTKESLKANLKKFLIAVMEEESKDGPINVVGQELLNEMTAAVDRGFQNDNVTNAIGGSVAGSFKTQAVQNAIGLSFGPAVERAVAGAVATNLVGSTDDLALIIDSQKAEIRALRQELANFKAQMGLEQPGVGADMMSTLIHLQNIANTNSENQRRIIKSLNDLGANVEEAQPVNPGGQVSHEQEDDSWLDNFKQSFWAKYILSAVIFGAAVIFGLHFWNKVSRANPEVNPPLVPTATIATDDTSIETGAQEGPDQTSFGSSQNKYTLSQADLKAGVSELQSVLINGELKSEFDEFRNVVKNACNKDNCATDDVWPRIPNDRSKILRHSLAQAALLHLSVDQKCNKLDSDNFEVDGGFGYQSGDYANTVMNCMQQNGVFRADSPAESCIDNNTTSSEKAVCLLREGSAGNGDTGLEATVRWAIAEVGRSGAFEK